MSVPAINSGVGNRLVKGLHACSCKMDGAWHYRLKLCAPCRPRPICHMYSLPCWVHTLCLYLILSCLVPHYQVLLAVQQVCLCALCLTVYRQMLACWRPCHSSPKLLLVRLAQDNVCHPRARLLIVLKASCSLCIDAKTHVVRRSLASSQRERGLSLSVLVFGSSVGGVLWTP